MDMLNFTRRRRLLSLLFMVVGCSPAFSEDGLVPAVVVRGEDSPNAQAIIVKQPNAQPSAATAPSKRVAKAVLPKSGKEKFPQLRSFDSFRTSEYKLADSNVVQANQIPVVEGAAEGVSGIQSQLPTGSSGPEIQQTQFLMSQSTSGTSPYTHHPTMISSDEFELDAHGETDSFVPMAVSIGDPSIASPDAYLAAPANDPTVTPAVTRKAKPTDYGVRVSSPIATSDAYLAAPSSRDARVKQESRPRFAVFPPKKSARTARSTFVGPSGLKSAIPKTPTVKKSGRASLFPDFLPKLTTKTPSWLQGSKSK